MPLEQLADRARETHQFLPVLDPPCAGVNCRPAEIQHELRVEAQDSHKYEPWVQAMSPAHSKESAHGGIVQLPLRRDITVEHNLLRT